MSKNNIYDDNYRKNFLKKADFKALNDYLKNLEKLAHKKGGRYLDMYNKDLEFLVVMNDKIYQDNEENHTNLLFGGSSVLYTMTEQGICDTEGYLNKIHNITQNLTSINKFNELESIKKILINETTSPLNVPNNDWINAIQRFMDILFSYNKLFTADEHEPFKILYLKEITKLIVDNKKFVKEALVYFDKLIKTDKHKISKELITKISELRNKKNNITKDEYTIEKENLIQNAIKKFNYEITYPSQFLEKIMSSYKNKNLSNNQTSLNY